MYRVDTREALIEATRELLWDRGYGATSPRAILDASGVGQGSMYHHFKGKEDLALAAVRRNSAEMRAQALEDLSVDGTALERIGRYLRREREVFRGCRCGRLAQDVDVIDSEALQTEVRGFFVWLQTQLAEVIDDGKIAGEFPARLDAALVGAAVAATLQGGYVLARATQDQAAFDAAITGVLDLLSGSRAAA